MSRELKVIAALIGLFLLIGVSPALAQDWVPYLEVAPSAHTVSPEVRALPQAAGHVGAVVDVPIRHRPGFVPDGGPNAPDPVLQTTPGPSTSSSQGVGFDGVAFNGYYPPDANLSVNGTQIVQTTNVLFAVYNTSGDLLAGPSQLKSLWTNLGGLCSTTNGGDPIVLWDKIAQRWLISQIAYTGNLRQDAVCIAVSRTSDATGAYNLYAFGFSRLPDYPKFGVWSGSAAGTSDYYFSANMFSTALYYGPLICAFNGGDMRTGATARFACVQGSTSHFSLLPSDFDGGTPPEAGEPNYLVELGTGISSSTGTTLRMFPFKATWTAGGGSLNNPSATTLDVAQYALACGGGGACIPQPGTTKQLDSLGDRLMYRLAFRKFGDYESLLANHSVNQGSGVVGIRWYEIRSSGSATLETSASVYQQGTYNGTDTNHRWMGSIAQDKDRNIALGYSTSSSLLYPTISYTGRAPGDTSGTLGTESDIMPGSGSETGGSRWGDYTSLSVDPSDDCTFWYTNEYFLPNSTNGVGWKTRIASFRFSTCSGGGGGGPIATSTSLNSSANPSTVGQSVTFTATVSPSAATGTVEFFDGGLSLGSAALTGGSAQLSTSSLIEGTHPITATYSGDVGYTGSTSSAVTQTVNAAATGTFSLSGTPLSPQPAPQGSAATFTITVTALDGFTGNVALSVSGVPPQSSASFNPPSVSGGSGQSTLTVTIGQRTPTKTYTLTITGTSGSLTATTSVTLIVQ